jgi:hypothetical protein
MGRRMCRRRTIRNAITERPSLIELVGEILYILVIALPSLDCG